MYNNIAFSLLSPTCFTTPLNAETCLQSCAYQNLFKCNAVTISRIIKEFAECCISGEQMSANTVKYDSRPNIFAYEWKGK